LASFIFVFGLLSFVTNSNSSKSEPGSYQGKSWEYPTKDSLEKASSFIVHAALEETIVSTYTLGIKYGKAKQNGDNIPISAHSYTSGFVSGIIWKPISILVNKTSSKHQFEYHVIGIAEWKLLGATIYSQSKVFSGLASLK
jgi:hypothetical protein